MNELLQEIERAYRDYVDNQNSDGMNVDSFYKWLKGMAFAYAYRYQSEYERLQLIHSILSEYKDE